MSAAEPSFIDRNRRRLEALIAAATGRRAEEGAVDFIGRILSERPDWEPRVQAVLGAFDEASIGVVDVRITSGAVGTADVASSMRDPEGFRWLGQLINAGYYADEDSGWNPGGRSWSAVGWTGYPEGTRTAEYRPPHSAIIGPEALAPRYDAVVIGSGAGGGVAACGLAESGRAVLVVEAGDWPTTDFLSRDHLHNPRSTWGLESRSGPGLRGNPRLVEAGSGTRLLNPAEREWNNNAVTAGGGTRVYGAQAWRFGPVDFRMASHYGVPPGSALADWPFGYEELEPYYERAEWEIGVSGSSDDGAYSGHRGRQLPMPALRPGFDAELLAGGAKRLGISTVSVPLLVNSVRYLERPACVQCGMCIGFACRVDAKNGSQNTMLPRAFASGNCSMLLKARAERLIADPGGKVVAVALVGESDGKLWHAQVEAGEFVLACGAVETPRLLLNSPTGREPFGIGNNADQVGRYLQAHSYGGAIGIAADSGEMLGPGPSIATGDFRHDNPGIVGGGIIVNDFVNTPSNLFRYLSDAGLVPAYGGDVTERMRAVARKYVKVSGPIQEVTTSASRVRVDTSVKDRFGVPVARMSGALHPDDLRARDYLTDRALEWLDAAGIRNPVRMPWEPPRGPSGGQHGAGTCRMGDDPGSSVTDAWGRIWGHPNVRITDGSVHVTNGGVNPVLTIFANAFRITDHMVAS